MTSFEFITVLYAVVVGLALTHLLSGFGRAIHLRARAPLWWVHVAWTVALFFFIAINWWTLFYLRDEATWTYPSYLYLLFYAVVLFLLVVLHYPPEPEGVPDYRAIFSTNRPWFLGTLTIAYVVDIGATALQGNLLRPWYYLPFVLHLIALTGTGAVYPQPRYQQFLALYTPSILLSWSLIVRGVLAQ
jgi:hypothetical protein